MSRATEHKVFRPLVDQQMLFYVPFEYAIALLATVALIQIWIIAPFGLGLIASGILFIIWMVMMFVGYLMAKKDPRFFSVIIAVMMFRPNTFFKKKVTYVA